MIECIKLCLKRDIQVAHKYLIVTETVSDEILRIGVHYSVEAC